MYLTRRDPPPNFDFGPVPEGNHGSMIMGITGFFTAFALTSFILRLYVRIFLLKMMGPDDYVMLIAVICSVSVFGLLVAEVHQGIGEHFGSLHLMMNYEAILHLSWYHAWLMLIGISSVKVSVGLFLLRLVQGKWYKRVIIGWITFLLALTVACFGTLIFQCLPVYAAWSFALKADPKTRCYSLPTYRNLGLFNGAINLFTDFVFASLPIPIILPLQINMRTKISLICILSLGYFACAASIVKETLLVGFFKNVDNLFNDAFNVWSDVEMNTGILAACLPTLRPLFASILKNASSQKLSESVGRTKISGTPNHYFREDDGKELMSMPSHSTLDGAKEGYGVRISGGRSPFDDERRLYRQDSVSSSPTSRLEKAIEENDSGSDEHIMPRLQGLGNAYVKRMDRRDWRDTRVWKDPSRGILRTTEVSVTR